VFGDGRSAERIARLTVEWLADGMEVAA
jgi:hypothetical protein